MDEYDFELDTESEKAPPSRRALYPHNRGALTYMQSCINAGVNASISAPNDTGFKFAAVDLIGSNPQRQFLYVTGTHLGIDQVTSHIPKLGYYDVQNVLFKTYGELCSASAAEMKKLAGLVNVVIFMDYLSLPVAPAQIRKLTAFLGMLNDAVVRIGVTNIREFFIEANQTLLSRHMAVLGDGLPVMEFFDLRTACMYGNFHYPKLICADIGQKARVTKFCTGIKSLGDTKAYSKYMNRARYYPITGKEVAAFFRESVLNELPDGKYVVLCKSQSLINKSEEELRRMFVTSEREAEYFFDSSDAENDITAFLEIQPEEKHFYFLLTTLARMLDVKVENAVGTILLYPVQAPWEMYQTLNAVLAFSRGLKHIFPTFIDFYNSNYNISYCGDDTTRAVPLRDRNCLFYELGTTDHERKMYAGTGRQPALLYAETIMPEVASFNKTHWDYEELRFKNDDLAYMADLIRRTEQDGWIIGKEHQYAINGVNLYDWCTEKERTGLGFSSENSTLSEEELEKLRGDIDRISSD